MTQASVETPATPGTEASNRGFLQIEEFAKRLGVPKSTVYAMRKHNELAWTKAGRYYLIPVTELQRLHKEAEERVAPAA